MKKKGQRYNVGRTCDVTKFSSRRIKRISNIFWNANPEIYFSLCLLTNTANRFPVCARVRKRAFGTEFFSKDATNATLIEARN